MTSFLPDREANLERRQSIVEEHRLLAEHIENASKQVEFFFSAPANQSPSDASRVVDLLDQLQEIARSHFQHEEALMASHEFPGLIFHKRDHDYLIQSLEEFHVFTQPRHCPVLAGHGCEPPQLADLPHKEIRRRLCRLYRVRETGRARLRTCSGKWVMMAGALPAAPVTPMPIAVAAPVRSARRNSGMAGANTSDAWKDGSTRNRRCGRCQYKRRQWGR